MASVLNSSSSPLLANSSFVGNLETCKNYSCIGVSLFADTSCRVSLQHLDKNGNLQLNEEYNTGASYGFYKAVVAKSTHFKVTVENTSAINQTEFRLITKLSNSVPDDINVKLNAVEDSVLALVSTNEGPVMSENGRLLVAQSNLSPISNGVLSHGANSSGQPVPLTVDDTGRLNVNSGSGPLKVNVSWCSTSLQSTPEQVTSGAGRLLRMSCFNDSAQARYIKVYNKDSTPSDIASSGDTPLLVLVLHPSQNTNFELGLDISVGCWIVAGENGGKTAAWGSVGADEVNVNAIVEVVN